MLGVLLIPLEGIGDYVDISAVVNPWQAVVIIVLIFAVLIWPSMSARASAKKIEKSLTTNNGGSTTKDALDSIKATLSDQNATMATQGEKLDTHIEAAAQRAADMAARLARLEHRRGIFR